LKILEFFMNKKRRKRFKNRKLHNLCLLTGNE